MAWRVVFIYIHSRRRLGRSGGPIQLYTVVGGAELEHRDYRTEEKPVSLSISWRRENLGTHCMKGTSTVGY